MAANTPFQPNTNASGTVGAGITVTLSGAAASVAGTIGDAGNALMVSNPNASVAIFFRTDLSPGRVATTADVPVMPLNRVIVSTPCPNFGGTLYVEAIAAASLAAASNVYFTPGEGGIGQT